MGNVVEHVPMATVVLSGMGERIRVKLMVDTGASRTFLPDRIAKKLKLDLTPSSQQTQAGGGSLKVQIASVGISLADADPDGPVGKEHLLNPVLIVDDDALPFPILGRSPFLNWYRLMISELDKELTLEEHGRI